MVASTPNDSIAESSRSVSATLSSASLPNAFQRLSARGESKKPIYRDTCKRPEPTYNDNYDPYKLRRSDFDKGYSLYTFGEPLFDGRLPIVERLPKHHTIAPTPKRLRTSWAWQLGYALQDNSKKGSPIVWQCKYCHHDVKFSAGRKYHFDANTLRNAENHLLDTHYLNKHGDTWRMVDLTVPAQASGVVDGSYEKIIPFRQLEFKCAFLEWMICDNVKQRKASSPRLLRLFKIANKEASKALPTSASTCATWIHDMFKYFEPEVIREIKLARSAINISFDGWGSKREKISVVGIVVHFINYDYKAVTRLIALPSLPKHSKTGVDQASVILPVLTHFGINKENLSEHTQVISASQRTIRCSLIADLLAGHSAQESRGTNSLQQSKQL